MTRMRYLKAAVTALAWLSATSAFADDLVKMTIGQRGNWDTSITHLGDKAGIFKKHGLQLEMIYTSGSGETLQPVISGSVDLGLAVGTLGAMAAYAKGAPVRIIGAQATGAADYWYAKNPDIKTLKDTNGHTIAFSTNGSSTNSVVRAFIDEFKLTAKPQATGNPSATLTAVMTDQVDVGWAAPPFGLKEMDEGKIHLVARATDAALVRGQTIRVLVANADVLAKRKDVIERFMKAYRESIDYMYSSNPQVIKDYAEFAKVPEPMAKRVRDEFFPKSLVNPDQIHGLDSSDSGSREPEIHSGSAHKRANGRVDPGFHHANETQQTDVDMTTVVSPQAASAQAVVLPKNRGAYYGGAWHEPKAGRYVDTINPGTGQSLGKVADSGADDIDAAVASAKAAFTEWRRMLPLERAKILRRIAEILRQNANELAMIDAADCGNPVKEMVSDAMIAAAQMEFFAGLRHRDEGLFDSDGPGRGQFLRSRTSGRRRPHHPVQSSIHVLRRQVRGPARRRQYGRRKATGTGTPLLAAACRTDWRPAAGRRVQRCAGRTRGRAKTGEPSGRRDDRAHRQRADRSRCHESGL